MTSSIHNISDGYKLDFISIIPVVQVNVLYVSI
jgi:hypothetical protein